MFYSETVSPLKMKLRIVNATNQSEKLSNPSIQSLNFLLTKQNVCSRNICSRTFVLIIQKA
ncbi:hypothetical protein J2S00_000154 [Caldalkalibacillus uzonensis]|uniref:Uncharacterized protein n=1 Tax=Caldalkalibacillus uzonensis TaxID=353224 RepID=A0ABU0CNB6_9BACI|nr:hypothetical protein [Caldalkalibacillus uzonensis]